MSSRLLGSAAVVSAATLLVKVFASAKEMVVAYRFGTTDALDAYLIAFMIPAFAINVLGGALSVAFVPPFVELREREGREAAQRFLSDTIARAAAVLVGVGLLLTLAVPFVLPALGSSFSPSKLALTRDLFLLLSPALVIAGVNGLLAGALNSCERFATAALVPLVTPALTVFLLAVAGRLGVGILAVGIVVGGCIEWGLLALALRREGFSVRPRRAAPDARARRLLGEFGAMVVTLLLSSGNALVDQAMAASLGAGAVSALNYANKVPAVLFSVSAGLWTAALPLFSQVLARGDLGGLRQMMRGYSRTVWALGLPVTAVVYLLSAPLVHLLYERGAFTGADTFVVAPIQAAYVLQLPAYVLAVMYQRLAISMRAGRLVMLGAAINLVLNAVLDVVLMRYLGVVGIAISTTCVAVASCLYLALLGRRLLHSQATDSLTMAAS
jgi:putative peptidoglycan lipid II flippase